MAAAASSGSPRSGASLIDQQATEGLQCFDQPQAVASLELPGQRLVAAVDRRCQVARHPGQPAQVVAGAGGIRRQTALSRVAGRLLVPASRVAVAALQLGQLAERVQPPGQQRPHGEGAG